MGCVKGVRALGRGVRFGLGCWVARVRRGVAKTARCEIRDGRVE